jgi:hypothetical protein
MSTGTQQGAAGASALTAALYAGGYLGSGSEAGSIPPPIPDEPGNGTAGGSSCNAANPVVFNSPEVTCSDPAPMTVLPTGDIGETYLNSNSFFSPPNQCFLPAYFGGHSARYFEDFSKYVPPAIYKIVLDKYCAGEMNATYNLVAGVNHTNVMLERFFISLNATAFDTVINAAAETDCDALNAVVNEDKSLAVLTTDELYTSSAEECGLGDYTRMPTIAVQRDGAAASPISKEFAAKIKKDQVHDFSNLFKASVAAFAGQIPGIADLPPAEAIATIRNASREAASPACREEFLVRSDEASAFYSASNNPPLEVTCLNPTVFYKIQHANETGTGTGGGTIINVPDGINASQAR